MERTLRIRYDPEVDALSLSFRDTTVTVQDLADGVVGEFDAEGQLVGLEILDASTRFGEPSTLREVILEGVGPSAPLTTGRSKAAFSPMSRTGAKPCPWKSAPRPRFAQL